MPESERCTVVEHGVINRTYTVVVHKVRNELDEDFWRVIVGNLAQGEIVQRDYLAWSRETPEGMLPDDAATDLLGIVLTS